MNGIKGKMVFIFVVSNFFAGCYKFNGGNAVLNGTWAATVQYAGYKMNIEVLFDNGKSECNINGESLMRYKYTLNGNKILITGSSVEIYFLGLFKAMVPLLQESGISDEYIAQYLDGIKQLGFDKWMDTNELQALALRLGNSEMISGLSSLSLVQEGGTFSIQGNNLTLANPDGSSNVLVRR